MGAVSEKHETEGGAMKRFEQSAWAGIAVLIIWCGMILAAMLAI